ncbi:hypothetical protein TNCV_4424731 [Trichonephila clavipes]|nr:hypothetical protein TNCV_4424731 [Trichonephila clavipes]
MRQPSPCWTTVISFANKRSSLVVKVELQRTGIEVYRIIVLLLMSFEIQLLIAEYGIEGLRLGSTEFRARSQRPLSLADEKTNMLPAWP